MTDIRLSTDSEEFHLRVRAVIIQDDGLVLLRSRKQGYYYLVGGHVKIGETTVQAVERECLEETGVPFVVDRAVWIHENFYTCDGRRIHEIVYYFLMKENSIPLRAVSDGGEALQKIRKDSLKDREIYPVFLREQLLCMPPVCEMLTENQIE